MCEEHDATGRNKSRDLGQRIDRVNQSFEYGGRVAGANAIAEGTVRAWLRHFDSATERRNMKGDAAVTSRVRVPRALSEEKGFINSIKPGEASLIKTVHAA